MSALETLLGMAQSPLDRESVIFRRSDDTLFTSSVHFSSASDTLQRKKYGSLLKNNLYVHRNKI